MHVKTNAIMLNEKVPVNQDYHTKHLIIAKTEMKMLPKQRSRLNLVLIV